MTMWDSQIHSRTTRVEILHLLALSGRQAYMDTLVGDPAPIVEAHKRRMKSPQPGDLVLELTTLHKKPWDPDGLGWLEKIAEEPVLTPEQWAEEERDGAERGPYDPAITDMFWHVRVLATGEVVRWHNSLFIALPSPDAKDWPR